MMNIEQLVEKAAELLDRCRFLTLEVQDDLGSVRSNLVSKVTSDGVSDVEVSSIRAECDIAVEGETDAKLCCSDGGRTLILFGRLRSVGEKAARFVSSEAMAIIDGEFIDCMICQEA